MEHLKESVINDLCKKISRQKDDLIQSKIKEICHDFNIEDEGKRKFKRIIVQREEDKETWYFNDGSISGKRIITFETVTSSNFHDSNKPFSITAHLKHY